MRAVFGALLFLAASVSAGAPPDVPAALKAKPGQLVRVVVKTDAEIGTLKNFTDAEAFWGELVGPKGQRQFVFQAPTDGARAEYVVGWWTKGETEGATTTITIEGAAPPAPPTPTPGPTPPKDVPFPGASGLHVLVVYESAELPKYPAGRQSAIYARAVRDYLNAKCPAGPDGKTKQWRMWDKDVNGADDAPVWDAAMKRPRASVPWVLIGTGRDGYEGPLPDSADEFLALLKKYGGN